MSGVKPPLLHFVTLYALSEVKNKSQPVKLEPSLLRCFPEPSSTSSVFLQSPPERTGLFCFPDVDRIQAHFMQLMTSSNRETSGTRRDVIKPDQLQQRVQDISFTLLLTDDAGKRYYGFAQRLALPGLCGGNGNSAIDSAHLSLPACVCVVTSYPWFQFWRLVLGWFTSRLVAYGDAIMPALSSPSFNSVQAEQALSSVWHDVEELAGALLAKKNVKPNELMNISTAYGSRRRVSELVKRPDDSLKPVGEDVASLLKAVGVEGFIALFAALLLERRVLIISSNMRLLSKCVFAAHSMIWPFVWQHVCIPIIPSVILEYLEAPMPFLIGVQHHHYLSMQSSILDAVVVNIDSNTVELVGASGTDVSMLPPAYAFHLKQKLTEALKMISSPTGLDQEEVYGACRVFLAKTVGHYEKFITRPLGCDEMSFDKEAFIASKQKAEKKFWSLFCESQMFHQFISEKLDMMNSPSGVMFASQFEVDVNNNAQDDTVRYLSDTAKAQMKKIEMMWKGSQTKASLKQNFRSISSGAQNPFAKHHTPSAPADSSFLSPSPQPSSYFIRQFPHDAGRNIFPVDDPFMKDFEEIQSMFAPPSAGSTKSPRITRNTSPVNDTPLLDINVVTSPSPSTSKPQTSTSASDLLFGTGPSPSGSLLDIDFSVPSTSPQNSSPALKPTPHRPVPAVPSQTTLTVDDYFSNQFTSQPSSNVDAFFSDSTFLADTPTTSPARPQSTPSSKGPYTPSPALAQLQLEMNEPFPSVSQQGPAQKRPLPPSSVPPQKPPIITTNPVRPAKPVPPARPAKPQSDPFPRVQQQQQPQPRPQPQPPKKADPFPPVKPQPQTQTKTSPFPPVQQQQPQAQKKADPFPPVKPQPQLQTKTSPFPPVQQPAKATPVPPARPQKPASNPSPFPLVQQTQTPAKPAAAVPQKPPVKTDPFPKVNDPFPAVFDPFPDVKDPFPPAKDPFPPVQAQPTPAKKDPFPTAPKKADPFPTAPKQPAKADPFPPVFQQQQQQKQTDPFPKPPRQGAVSIDDFFTPQTTANPFAPSSTSTPAQQRQQQQQPGRPTQNVFDFF